MEILCCFAATVDGEVTKIPYVSCIRCNTVLTYNCKSGGTSHLRRHVDCCQSKSGGESTHLHSLVYLLWLRRFCQSQHQVLQVNGHSASLAQPYAAQNGFRQCQFRRHSICAFRFQCLKTISGLDFGECIFPNALTITTRQYNVIYCSLHLFHLF